VPTRIRSPQRPGMVDPGGAGSSLEDAALAGYDRAMRFLALGSEVDISFPGRSRDDAAALGRAEARQSWRLYQAGIVREISFRTDAHRSVMILEAPDEAAARAALDTLPFVRAGILTFEVMGLRAYDGWARLFASEGE